MSKHGCPGATPVSDYTPVQRIRSVSTLDIIAVLWSDTIRVGAARLEFTPEDVWMHSLRSGGAMAMHIMGVPDRTLMDIGRWRSLRFRFYVQQQISSFRDGVSVKMSQQPWFWHLWEAWRPSSPPKHLIHTSTYPGPVWWTKRHLFADRPTKTPFDHSSTSPSQFPTETHSK